MYLNPFLCVQLGGMGVGVQCRTGTRLLNFVRQFHDCRFRFFQAITQVLRLGPQCRILLLLTPNSHKVLRHASWQEAQKQTTIAANGSTSNHGWGAGGLGGWGSGYTRWGWGWVRG